MRAVAAWYAFPTAHSVAVPAGIVAVCLVTFAVLARRAPHDVGRDARATALARAGAGHGRDPAPGSPGCCGRRAPRPSCEAPARRAAGRPGRVARPSTRTESCMPRDPQVLVYVGIRNAVVALDDRTGTEVWRAELRSSDYVAVLWDGEALLAANAGEVWRLDPQHGHVLWHNELKGMGRGLVSLASSRRPTGSVATDVVAEKRRRDDQAAGAAAGA